MSIADVRWRPVAFTLSTISLSMVGNNGELWAFTFKRRQSDGPGAVGEQGGRDRCGKEILQGNNLVVDGKKWKLL